MIFKDDNRNILFIINDFIDWYKDGKMSILLVFFLLQTNALLRQSLLSIRAASVRYSRTELSRHAVLCQNGRRVFVNSENGMMGFAT